MIFFSWVMFVKKNIFLFCLIFIITGCDLNKVSKPKDDKSETKIENNVGEKSSISEYIFEPVLDQRVNDLAKIGIKNYQTRKLLDARKEAQLANKTGGNRAPTWIFDTFSKSEEQIVDELKAISGPSTWTIEEIDKEYRKILASNPPDSSLTVARFNVVKGLSVNYWHDYPLGKNAIVQLASQFNYLEAVSSELMSVSDYLSDYTQGPQGSIEAAAAAIHRRAAVLNDKLPHALKNILLPGYEKYYKNGYLEPTKIPKAEIEKIVNHMEENISQLEILPQWAKCEPSGAIQLQVFSAAPSFQGRGTPSKGSLEEKICHLLVPIQYEAIAKLAVIRSIKTKNPVPVHLTLVGQGAFQNPPSVMREAFARVAKVIKGHENVKIFIHAFSDSAHELVLGSLDSGNVDLVEMRIEEFKTERF
jgi:hypothetical protein